jgi:hypothetical protein
VGDDKEALMSGADTATAGNLGYAGLEVTLEQEHESFWRPALAGALTGAPGSGTFRFAARALPGRASPGDVVGEAFTMMRSHGSAPSDPGDPAATAALLDLDEELQAFGWEPVEAPGPRWWSRRYTRPPTVPRPRSDSDR